MSKKKITEELKKKIEKEKTRYLKKEREVEFDDIGKEIFVAAKRRKINYQKGGFFVVNQVTLQRILRDKKRYTGETLRVLMFLMSIVEYDNRIKSYTQTQIADMMGIKQPQVSRAMKELEADEIIKKDGRDFYFDSNFLTKGQWTK